jgi:DHA1 family bicyclomycin/chloramphenicol resistance-like MFS transporter
LTVTLANQVNRTLLKRMGPARILFFASLAQTAVAIALFGGSWTGFLGKYPIIVLIACFLFCFGFVLPNSTALLLQPFEKNAGSASALSGAALMVTGTLASGLVSYLQNGTAVPMTAAMGVCAVLGFALMTAETVRGRKKAEG